MQILQSAYVGEVSYVWSTQNLQFCYPGGSPAVQNLQFCYLGEAYLRLAGYVPFTLGSLGTYRLTLTKSQSIYDLRETFHVNHLAIGHGAVSKNLHKYLRTRWIRTGSGK